MSDDGMTRRTFLGMATAAGAVVACGKRHERPIIPYVVPPDDLVPGQSRQYRTICRACPSACGVSATMRDGRVLKLEGNPEHPLNAGALCARGQAAIEGLYDSERLSGPLANHGGVLRAGAWEPGIVALTEAVKRALDANQTIAVVSRPEPGAMGALLAGWLTALGREPDGLVVMGENDFAWARAGRQRVFGASDTPSYDVGAARVLLAIGADFLDEGPWPVEMSRGLAAMRGRTLRGEGRFVYAGPRLSMTAAAADQWLVTHAGSELHLVLGLARLGLALGAEGVSDIRPGTLERLRAALEPFRPDAVAQRTGVSADRLQSLARDFVHLRPSLCLGPGRVAGGTNAVALAAAVNLLNAIAGNHNHTVLFWQGADQHRPTRTTADLRRELAGGRVGVLVCHHADVLGGAGALDRSKVRHVVSLGNWPDETAHNSDWVLPDHHFLEAWGEVIPRPGLRGAQQPAMRPLADTRAAADVLLDVARRLGKTEGLPDGDWASFVHGRFSEAELERGGVFTPPAARPVTVTDDPLGALELVEPVLDGPANGAVLTLFTSHKHPDGQPRERLLQEIPDPVTTIAWSGWCEMHPDDAGELGVTSGDLVAVEAGSGKIELPAYVHPGVGHKVLAVPAAFGRELVPGGRLGDVGLFSRARIARTGRRLELPHAGNGRTRGTELARWVSTASPPRAPGPLPSLAVPHSHPQHRWGLIVDLQRCTGCSACVAACYVENNVPVVGAEGVRLGREMAWIRIDRFLTGSAGRAELRFLPVMCQHCCNAPCESVCPVYTTYHTAEGLNAQIYNRCVGTRYCENNCPYTVRRFNFWDQLHPDRALLSLNPDVTVRQRGVVEKCTFCVQRIRAVEERAKLGGRRVRDGEIVTACAETCPSGALVFGDLADPTSRAATLARERRAYRLLEELNTAPGVHYLARVEKGGLG